MAMEAGRDGRNSLMHSLTRAPREKGTGVSVLFLRLMFRIWSTRFAARLVASIICLSESSTGSFGGNCDMASSAWSMMGLRMLLKSCAIPPASVPMASIFWASRSLRSNSEIWARSRQTLTKPTTTPCCPRMGDTVLAHSKEVPSRLVVAQRPAPNLTLGYPCFDDAILFALLFVRVNKVQAPSLYLALRITGPCSRRFGSHIPRAVPGP